HAVAAHDPAAAAPNSRVLLRLPYAVEPVDEYHRFQCPVWSCDVLARGRRPGRDWGVLAALVSDDVLVRNRRHLGERTIADILGSPDPHRPAEIVVLDVLWLTVL